MGKVIVESRAGTGRKNNVRAKAKRKAHWFFERGKCSHRSDFDTGHAGSSSRSVQLFAAKM